MTTVKSNMRLLRKAAAHWSNIADKRTRRHYQRQWLRAVGILGDRWVLAQGSTYKGVWL